VWGCAPADGEPWSTKGVSVVHRASPPVRGGGPSRDDAGLRDRAIEILLEAVRSPRPVVRANAIEALHPAPEYLEPVVSEALGDENRGVRFVAAMTAAQVRLCSLVPLIEPLRLDESESVQAAALLALRLCGHAVSLDPLARWIRSDDPEVRANTAMVLAEMGNPSAIPMIREAAPVGMGRVSDARVRIVTLQMAEAMVSLGAGEEIEAIRAALFLPSEQGEATALACMMCGRLGDERALSNLEQLALRSDLQRPPAEVRMAAAWGVAQLAPERAPLQVPLEYTRSHSPTLRMQAAHTLGRFPARPEVVAALRAMLEDPEAQVRVAAAGAVLLLTAE
jgi:HEAT repeat protein